MSTDYRYTIRRKADGKKIAVFYYDMIKNLNDISCEELKLKLDPEHVGCNEDDQVRYNVIDIDNDIDKLEMHVKLLTMKIFEKKLLVPTAANRDIKDDIEADIFTLETEIKNCMYAIEALAGLSAVVNVFVEDQVDITNELVGEDRIAYVYNAKGLPKTEEGYDPHLWASDVYIECQACC